MSENPWTAPESAIGPAKDPLHPEAGLPNVMDLVTAAVGEVQKDFLPWLLAGLPPALVAIMGGFGAVFMIYGGMGVGMLPGLMADDEDVAVLGAMGGLFLGMFIVIAGLSLVIAPMNASMWRAVWRHLTQGEKLEITSSLKYVFEDLPRVLMFNVVFMGIIFAGSMMCYLPGILAAVALTFAYPAVVVHGLPIGTAISRSVKHAQENPAWHLGLFGVVFVMSLVLPYVPFIGYALLFTLYPLFILSAYRAVYGDEVSSDPGV